MKKEVHKKIGLFFASFFLLIVFLWLVWETLFAAYFFFYHQQPDFQPLGQLETNMWYLSLKNMAFFPAAWFFWVKGFFSLHQKALSFKRMFLFSFTVCFLLYMNGAVERGVSCMDESSHIRCGYDCSVAFVLSGV